MPKIVVNTTGTPPIDASLKIGELDTNNNTAKELNRRPDVTLGDADIERLAAALDANGQDISNVGAFDSDSVSTDYQYTKDRDADAVIQDDGGTIRAAGDDGEIASGSDGGAVLQSIIDALGAECKITFSDNIDTDTPVDIGGNSRVTVDLNSHTLLATSAMDYMLSSGQASAHCMQSTIKNGRLSCNGNADEGIRPVAVDGLTVRDLFIDDAIYGIHGLSQADSGLNSHQSTFENLQINDPDVGMLMEPDTSADTPTKWVDPTVKDIKLARPTTGGIRLREPSRWDVDYALVFGGTSDFEYAVRCEAESIVDSSQCRDNTFTQIDAENLDGNSDPPYAVDLVVPSSSDASLVSTHVEHPASTLGSDPYVRALADGGANINYCSIEGVNRSTADGVVARLEGNNGANVRQVQISLEAEIRDATSSAVDQVGGVRWTTINGHATRPDGNSSTASLPPDQFQPGTRIEMDNDGVVYELQSDGSMKQISPGDSTDLSGFSGAFPGYQRYDDSTNTSGEGVLCLWIDTDGDGTGDTWQPTDRSAQFT